MGVTCLHVTKNLVNWFDPSTTASTSLIQSVKHSSTYALAGQSVVWCPLLRHTSQLRAFFPLPVKQTAYSDVLTSDHCLWPVAAVYCSQTNLQRFQPSNFKCNIQNVYTSLDSGVYGCRQTFEGYKLIFVCALVCKYIRMCVCIYRRLYHTPYGKCARYIQHD